MVHILDIYIYIFKSCCLYCTLHLYLTLSLLDHEERHICFAEARFEGGSEGVNKADGTGQFFEGRATQVTSYFIINLHFVN